MYDESQLAHYGVKGMRWGVRKQYMYDDGGFTKRGKKRYSGEKGRERLARDINQSRRKGKTVGGLAGAMLGVGSQVSSGSRDTPIGPSNSRVRATIAAPVYGLGGAALGSAVGSLVDYIGSRTISDAKLSDEYRIADDFLRRNGMA